MTKKITATALVLSSFFNGLFAQDSTKTLAISGGLDGYYRYNFSGNSANNNTSFTNSQNSFELGMATIKADATALSGKVTATVDLGFGRRSQEFSYKDGDGWLPGSGNNYGSLSIIKQAYVTYAPSSKVKFTLGKFGTHVGYELVDAQLNRNYSMSYMFTNGPFFHTGFKTDITAGPVGFMVGVSNYTDQSTSTNNVKSVIAQVSGGSSNGKLKAFLNYVGSYGSNKLAIPGGLKSLSQLDLVVTGVVTDKFNVGFNGTIQSRQVNEAASSGSWKGAALYLNVDPTEKVGLTLRSEYISDSKKINFGTKNIFANTLSVNCKVGPLTIIPELRFENAQSEFYTKNDGTGSKSTATALVAAVYKF